MKNYIQKTIDFYNTSFDEYFNKTLNLQDKSWLEKFTSFLNPSSKILDIGCAFGRDSKYFSENNFEAYGIDLSIKMIKKAKEFSPLSKFFVMDMMNLKFDDNFFDGIWCSAALLHLNKKDALLAMKEFKRVLKNDGVLYLNLKEGEGEKYITDDRYNNVEKFYSYYSEFEIKNILKKENFKIIDFLIEKNFTNGYDRFGKLILIAKNQKLL